MADVIEVDEPTRRLATWLAVAFAVLFAAQLLGITSRGRRFFFDVVTLLCFVAALLLRQGRQGARTALVVYGMISVVAGALGGTFFLHHAAVLLFAAVSVALNSLLVVAVAFTLEELDPSLGLPERWRPWATSRQFHVVVLVLVLLPVIIGGR